MRVNPIPGGGAILHTPTNFWTTDDTERTEILNGNRHP